MKPAVPPVPRSLAFGPVRASCRTWLALFAAATACGAFAQPQATERAVNLGDTPAQVLKELGEPRGRMKLGSSEIWNYERGEVAFQNNVVESSYLLDDDQVVAKRARLAAAAAKRAADERAAAERAAREAVEQAKQAAAAAAAASNAVKAAGAPAAATTNAPKPTVP